MAIIGTDKATGRHPVEIEHPETDRRVFVRVNGYEIDISIDEDGVLVTLSHNGDLCGEMSGDF